MRKFITLLISLILVMSLTVSTGWAASGKPSAENVPVTPIEEPKEPTLEELEPIDVTLAKTQIGYAIVYDANGKAVDWIEIIITPVADKDTTPYEDIAYMLDRAYKQILGVESVEELTKELLPYIRAGRTLVISDLFDVSIKGSNNQIIQNYLENHKYTLRFKLRLPIEDDDFWLVLHNYEGYKWRIEPDVSSKEDIVTIHVDSISPFAVVREIEEQQDDKDKDKDKDKNKPSRPVGPVKPSIHSGNGEGSQEQGEPGGPGEQGEPGIDEPATGTDVPTGTDIHEHNHKGEGCMCDCTGFLPCCLCWVKGFIIGVILTALICIVVILLLGRKARKEREKRQELEKNKTYEQPLHKSK